MMQRRYFLLSSVVIAAAAGSIGLGSRRLGAQAEETESFGITRSDAEWQELLTEDQYRVLRKEATERAFTSPHNEEKRSGLFHCAGCDQAVYSSRAKFDSGTGWPSFYQSIADAVGTKEDRSFFMVRIECHCARCGGHLGHIFDDGPQPTGKRHCINGVALTFNPGQTQPA